MLLAILLGPQAALIVIASVLTVQALFFADGGLLALGANLFNLGVIPCFVAYPLIYRLLAGARPGARRSSVAVIAACVVAAQLGALAVVLQTVASGISALPAGHFVALMLPIHLAIGLVEGLATAAVLFFLRRARPELLVAQPPARLRPLLLGLGLAAALTGGVLSLFASAQPDGPGMVADPSQDRDQGQGETAAQPALHAQLDALQQRIAWLPDYTLRAPAAPTKGTAAAPAVDAGTSLAGLVGGLLTLALVVLIGLGLRRAAARRHLAPMNRLAVALQDLRALDTLAARDTPLSRHDPRAKLLVTLVFVITLLSFSVPRITLLPLALFPVVLAAQGAVPTRATCAC